MNSLTSPSEAVDADRASRSSRPARICVIIPAYRVRAHVLSVIERVPAGVECIIVVDDACPDASGAFVEAESDDPRLVVIRHEDNQGVGGAVLTGFEEGIKRGADILIKIDGDGQMDPALSPNFAEPIINGEADYVKGNRFFYLDSANSMPLTRRIGNLGLTFISRFATGYYSISDPTNGYVAISAPLAANLPTEKLSRRYFFETDILFRINTLGASVMEIPHAAYYGDEQSNLKVTEELFNFFKRNIATYFKRLFYQYILRDFNAGSLLLFFGLIFGGFGLVGALSAWVESSVTGVPRSGGALALLEVMIILSAIFLVGFLNYDIGREPKRAISSRLLRRAAKPLDQY